MDIADPASVESAVSRFQPWAVINASGYVKVDNAEHEFDRCLRENTLGPGILAAACAARGIQLLTFSSDLVFDGERRSPYLERDPVRPLNNYGKSKAEAERRVFEAYPEALVVRTSAFFGPWDDCNFITLALTALLDGRRFPVSSDITVSPTYVPDLVHASLDLLIDRTAGIWHLTNAHPLTWAEFAVMAAEKAGIDCSGLEARASTELGYVAVRPAYSALSSERGIILPTLDDALDRYVATRRHGAAAEPPEKITNARK